jgi:DNA repair protein RadD
MQLRPRQQTFRDNCNVALKQHGNTIGVATVGFGKTIVLSAITAERPRSLVLQHRIELLDQNRQKFNRVAPGLSTSTFAADHKRWSPNGHTFAMVQTLIANLDKMQPVDIVTIDECHHVEAASYQEVISRARELNPATQFLGLTATPERGDGKSLRSIFTNVADVVSLTEMVQAGFLVKPRTFVIEIAGMTEQLKTLKKGRGEFNMDAAAVLMDTEKVAERVVEEWTRLAADRRTIGFATNVAHSKRMCEAFRLAGVACEHIDGTTPPGERKAIWRRLRSGETQMVWNCNVATEGFDEPSVSCVILDRPALHRSTMIQMVGRGLRTISEPHLYPGLVKDDCIIIDLGSSLTTHGSLEIDADIDGCLPVKPGEAPTKECPECGTSIPAGCRVCPMCEHEFLFQNREGKTQLGNFVLTEIDILNLSPYRWEPLWDGVVVVAEAMTASAILVQYKGIWFAYGIVRGFKNVQLLARSHDKVMALAKGDDFLREHGDKSAARKSKRWLTEPLSDKQADLLGVPRPAIGFAGGLFGGSTMNRYAACCHLTWKFNQEKIRKSIEAQV